MKDYNPILKNHNKKLTLNNHNETVLDKGNIFLNQKKY